MSRLKSQAKTKINSVDANGLPELPEKWCWVTLHEIAAWEPNAITDGPFGSNLKSSHYTESGPRVIRLQNIGDGCFIDEYARISETHFRELAKHEIVAGDIAIAALGEKLPRCCVIPPWVGPAIVKADCPRFRPNTKVVLPSYVNFALNSPEVRRRTSEIIHGVGRPRLNLAEIRGIWVPLAPLSEQYRIVAKIDELLTDLDAGVAALMRAKANLKRYRASVLKAAVEGHLTAAWRTEHPGSEPASALLARILTERRQKWEADQLAKFTATGKPPPKNWKDKYPKPSPPDTANLPELPKDWCWTSIIQVCDVRSGQTPNGINDVAGPNGEIPWFKVGDMNRDGNETWMRNAADFLSIESVRHLGINVQPSGTIVFPKRGGAIATNKKRRLAMDSAYDLNTMGLIPVSDVCEYIWMWFQGVDLRKLSDGSNVPQINHGDIEPLQLPLPPLSEQKQIVELVVERLSQIDAAQEQVEHGILRASRLRQSILKQAFDGNLVPQDSTDEPASELLRRLHGKQNTKEGNGRESPRTQVSRRKYKISDANGADR